MTRRRPRRRYNLLPIILLSGLCCVVGLIAILSYITTTAKNKFGPPAQELSAIQKYHLSYSLVMQAENLLKPTNPAMGEQLIVIEPGESVTSVSKKLFSLALIPEPEVFNKYLIYSGTDRCIRSGEYYLDGSMSAVDVAQKLCTSMGDRSEFGILPGWRVEEIANSLESYGFSFESSEFLYLVRNPQQIKNLPEKYKKFSTLEGFLAPGSYKMDKEISTEDFILMLVNQFEENLTNKIEKGFAKQGLSLYEGVTLASIVQKEAIVDEEKAAIAGVFINRISAGMRLETDPTVQYALGYSEKHKTWWKVPLSYDDLAVNSPFNTYQVDGLPPTPICNPGIDALRAVANPDQHGYYYFRAACDNSGLHLFATSLDEHIQNACP